MNKRNVPTDATCPACAALARVSQSAQCNRCRRTNPSSTTQRGTSVLRYMNEGMTFEAARDRMLAEQG